MSHLAALYCLTCSCGVMILKGSLSLSIANIMLHRMFQLSESVLQSRYLHWHQQAHAWHQEYY